VDASVQWSPARAFPYHPCSCLGQELSASCIILSCLTSLWPSFFYRWPNASQNMSKQMPCCHVQEFLQSVQVCSSLFKSFKFCRAAATCSVHRDLPGHDVHECRLLETTSWTWLVDTCGYLWSFHVEPWELSVHLVEDIFNETAARCTCRLLKGLKIFTNLEQRFSCDHLRSAITWDILEFCRHPKCGKWMQMTKLGNFRTWDSDSPKKLKDTVCLLHVTVSDFIVRDLSEPEWEITMEIHCIRLSFWFANGKAHTPNR
jgi:hypothetical protein